MESLFEPVELNRETTQMLDQIRSGAENALYGATSAAAETNLNRLVLPLVEGSGMPNLQVMHYRWFLRELARLWRTRNGRDLAFHLELCIRKWVNLGLEPRTLQFLVCEAHQRLKGENLTTKTPRHEGPAKTGTVPHGVPPEGSQVHVQRPEEAAYTALGAEAPEVRGLGGKPSSKGLSPAFAPETPPAESVQSVKSVDVRSLETAKDAKTAESGPDSDTRPLDSLTPGVLP